jgi:murein DD-endopeptidase MepM/ murein hydrolase activator NlpD
MRAMMVRAFLFLFVAATAPMAASAARADDSRISPNVSDVIGASESSPLGAADPAFREIFANWTGREAKTEARVVIPSRAPVRDYKLTSDYGPRSDPFRGGRRQHKGVDMAGPVGTPIYATADGIVGMAERFGSYGKFVEINHGNEIQTRYAHLSGINVQPFQRVKAGDLIGFMGSTGRSTGSHLHYEVRIAGEAVNPMPFMRESSFMVAAADKPAGTAAATGLGGPAE